MYVQCICYIMSQLPHQAYNHWAAHGDYKPDYCTSEYNTYMYMYVMTSKQLQVFYLFPGKVML